MNPGAATFIGLKSNRCWVFCGSGGVGELLTCGRVVKLTADFAESKPRLWSCPPACPRTLFVWCHMLLFDQDSAKGIIWDYTKVSSSSYNPASAPDFRFTSALVSCVAASSPETHPSSHGKRHGSSWKNRLKEKHNCRNVRFGAHTLALTHPYIIQRLNYPDRQNKKKKTNTCWWYRVCKHVLHIYLKCYKQTKHNFFHQTPPSLSTWNWMR